MSRMIDADALEKEGWSLHRTIRVDKNTAEYQTKPLKQIPTIEERKTGRWIHDGYDHPHGVDWCHCSICGNRESVDSVYTQVDIYPYCAKCGAIMMEVEHAEI